MGYTENARANHRNGNSCSVSLFKAFADKLGISEDEAAKIAPPPRSEGGKCGGYLAGRKMLEMLKPETVEEFEINITSINEYSDTKNIIFEIIDKSLLEKSLFILVPSTS